MTPLSTRNRNDPTRRIGKVVVEGISTIYEVNEVKGTPTRRTGYEFIVIGDEKIVANAPTGGRNQPPPKDTSATAAKTLGQYSWTYTWDDIDGKSKGELKINGIKQPGE